MDRREDGSLLQLARLALIVAAPGRCGGLRGRPARRRRRGTECLRAASGAQARNVPRNARSVTRRELRRIRDSVILARRYRERRPAGSGALRAPLKPYGKYSPIRQAQGVLSRLMLDTLASLDA